MQSGAPTFGTPEPTMVLFAAARLARLAVPRDVLALLPVSLMRSRVILPLRFDDVLLNRNERVVRPHIPYLPTPRRIAVLVVVSLKNPNYQTIVPQAIHNAATSPFRRKHTNNPPVSDHGQLITDN